LHCTHTQRAQRGRELTRISNVIRHASHTNSTLSSSFTQFACLLSLSNDVHIPLSLVFSALSERGRERARKEEENQKHAMHRKIAIMQWEKPAVVFYHCAHLQCIFMFSISQSCFLFSHSAANVEQRTHTVATNIHACSCALCGERKRRGERERGKIENK
jgi:hypothetical protein